MCSSSRSQCKKDELKKLNRRVCSGTEVGKKKIGIIFLQLAASIPTSYYRPGRVSGAGGDQINACMRTHLHYLKGHPPALSGLRGPPPTLMMRTEKLSKKVGPARACKVGNGKRLHKGTDTTSATATTQIYIYRKRSEFTS